MFLRIIRSDTNTMLMDQAVVSGGNFLTALVLARTLSPAHYGLFSLLFLALFGINTCHSSLVVYPLTLRGAVADPRELRQLSAAALLHTVVLSLPLACMLCVVAVVLHHAELCVSLALAMLAWQLQETTRRILLACRRTASAILPDAFCYVGQAALLFALRPSDLSSTFLLLAATSIVACVWQLALIGMELSREYVSSHARMSWQMGRFVLGGNLLNMLSLQLPGWALLSVSGGAPAVAGYQSLLNLAGFANPIIFSASNLLIPAVAREAERGVAHARRTVLRQGLRYGALLLPGIGILLLAPHFAMRMAYGPTSPYLSLAGLLRPFALAFTVQYFAAVVGAYEGGMSRPRTYFWVQIASTGVLASAGLLLIHLFSVQGAVFAMLLAAVVRLIMFVLCATAADRKAARVDFAAVNQEVIS